MTDELLTVPEVAQRLKLKESTIRRMVLERRIETVRPARRAVRIPSSAVQRLIDAGTRLAVSVA